MLAYHHFTQHVEEIVDTNPSAAEDEGQRGVVGDAEGLHATLAAEDMPQEADEMALFCEQMMDALGRSFRSGVSRPKSKRLEQLKNLLELLERHEAELIDALREDLGRPATESLIYDVLSPKHEIKSLIKNLGTWMKPEPVADSLVTFPATTALYPEPFGVVFVCGTWNFPIMLTLVPLAAAIAGGNCVVVKPSQVSGASARLLGRLLRQYMDPRVVRVVGHTHPRDRHVISALMRHPFDYIFYTGSPAVGRKIMVQAAEFLTPCTLELGGKNPVIVSKDANIDLAAKRTVWGRMMNAGQQCIAPDFVLAEGDVVDAFLDRCAHHIRTMYDSRAAMGRIVDGSRMGRLVQLLEDCRENIVVGGDYDVASR